jgi:hypothetical protein
MTLSSIRVFHTPKFNLLQFICIVANYFFFWHIPQKGGSNVGS